MPQNHDSPQDHVFRYRLDPQSGPGPLYRDRPAELVRAVMESLLNTAMPRREGADVKVDAFRWLARGNHDYAVFRDAAAAERADGPCANGGFQDTQTAAFYEPRIALVKQLAEALLNLVEFEHKGQPVKVDGFRLKDPNDWLVPGPADPAEVFDYAASRCTCDCVFCCNKGNPPSLAPSRLRAHTPEDELSEMLTRMKYLSPDAGMSLFPAGGAICEAMTHPHFLTVLKRLRSKTDRPFRITTNGNSLTPAAIDELARLKPVYLYLSLNSASVRRRGKVMKDPRPEVAIGALPLLERAEIPYAAVIVPWPLDGATEMLADLSATVAYAAENRAHIIQVNLPGFSRFFSATSPFDTQEVWPAIVSRVRELREETACPIVVMPALYEENLHEIRKNLPLVLGVVRNSPAQRGGVQRGDLLLQVCGIPVHDRPQARDMLAALRNSGSSEAAIRVTRQQQTLELTLQVDGASYPYDRQMDDYLGVVFMGTGLRRSYLENLRDIIDRRGARQVLFLSSQLMRPVFEQYLAESHLASGCARVDVDVPANTFFGGNIIMGDLLVVQDFIDCIKEHLARGERPDLVVIPSSPFNLSGWGRDLTGRVYLDIERATSVPLEVLPCTTIYS